MPHDVIMPALGMAQETGLIVAWLKKPGDAVAKGEPIMEVETDKATVEVEAQASGFLVAIRAGEGDNVPVGDVIAVISDSRDDIEEGVPAAAEAAAPLEAVAQPVVEPSPVASSAPEPAPSGRVLASPKARRMAAERGLDLQNLADAGMAQPFHAADVESYAMPSAGVSARRLETRVPSEALDLFLSGLAADDRIVVPGAVATVFAAASFRAERNVEDVTIRLERPGVVSADLANPDRGAGEGDGRHALIVRDLTGTRMSASSSGSGVTPVLTLTRSGADFVAALEYAPSGFDEAQAIRFLAGFAERMEMPLRQLL